MVELLERPVLRGAQVPRIRVVPAGVDHPKLGEIAKVVERLWPSFDEWQWDVLRSGLLRTRDLERWAAFAVAVCAPRQNGKNVILEAREVIGPTLLGERFLIHSAHLADTSKEGFRRLDQIIDEDDWLAGEVEHIWRQNGHETIEFKSGGRIRFRTRTRGGGRGFSGSPVIFDEAMFIPEVSMASIMPVISAQPDPQIWYMGSAVDQAFMEDGIVFARVRDRALSGDHQRLAYFEWSLDAETPDQVEMELPRDLEELATANPAFGIRISSEYLEAEWRELDARSHAVERGGVGDWPPVDGSADQVIALEKWDALVDDPADEGARMMDPVCLTFDVKVDRSSTAIVACGRRADRFAQLEVVDRRPGTKWVADRLVDLSERHEVAVIRCAGSSPAESLVGECERAGLVVEVLNTTDHAKACGVLFDGVNERMFRHLGGSDLRDAVKGATKRQLGDSWLWSRKNSTVDISPLVAATLAFDALMDQPDGGTPESYVW